MESSLAAATIIPTPSSPKAAAVVNTIDDSPTKQHAVVILDSTAEAAAMYDSRKQQLTTQEAAPAEKIPSTPEKPKKQQREETADEEWSPGPRGRRSARVAAMRERTPEVGYSGGGSVVPVSPSPTKRRRSPVPMKTFAGEVDLTGTGHGVLSSLCVFLRHDRASLRTVLSVPVVES